MKKAVRIIIPLILLFAIIACIGWYLFVFDREFTRDMLLYGARYFDNTGNHSVSSWFYDRAYEQSGDNDAVAIELAQQHKNDGNFTKAEYTLSKAISDGGSVDLYIALCKTYVVQDKLLDAVTMLNNVTNPDIKAELDALRPSIPTCSPNPNETGAYHTQYITVTLSAETGTLYANSNGEFPSVNKDLYKNGITLVDGENVIYAVAVGENGLVSPAAVFGFTVGGIISKVEFVDKAIEDSIRNLLNVGSNSVLYSNDLWEITDFTVPAEATSLEDLKHLLFLQKLTIQNSVSGQLTNIAGLSYLRELYITDTVVSNDELLLIGNLTNLERLTLNGCRLSTIAGLENCIQLTYLDLGNNTLRNITPLKNLTKLQHINLEHNALNDLSSISSIDSLTELNVSYNSLTTVSPLCSITGLKWLEAGHNALIDLAGFHQLSSLEYLDVSFNSIADLTPLSFAKDLRYLNVSDNTIVDISMLSELNNLAEFNFSNNQVSKLPKWSTDSLLVNIDGSHNLLESLEELSGLQRLNNVFMDYNTEIDSVDCLAGCPVLIEVNVFGTKVSEVSSLTSQSIVVNFDPTQ